jgi:hypothetical protein
VAGWPWRFEGLTGVDRRAFPVDMISRQRAGASEIASVEASQSGPRCVPATYWGNQTWGKNKDASAAAGLPPDEDRSEYPHLWRSRAAYSRSVDTTLVKITTDSGIVGWGESKTPVPQTSPRRSSANCWPAS